MELFLPFGFLKTVLPILAIIAGIFVITTKNAIISVFNLIVLYILVAFYLIFIGIAYMGISYIVIYIGAIAILFLFVIMMIDIEVVEKRSNNYLPLLFLLLGGFFFTLKNILYNIGVVKMKSLSINIRKKSVLDDNLFNIHLDNLNSGNLLSDINRNSNNLDILPNVKNNKISSNINLNSLENITLLDKKNNNTNLFLPLNSDENNIKKSNIFSYNIDDKEEINRLKEEINRLIELKDYNRIITLTELEKIIKDKNLDIDRGSNNKKSDLTDIIESSPFIRYTPPRKNKPSSNEEGFKNSKTLEEELLILNKETLSKYEKIDVTWIKTAIETTKKIIERDEQSIKDRENLRKRIWDQYLLIKDKHNNFEGKVKIDTDNFNKKEHFDLLERKLKDLIEHLDATILSLKNQMPYLYDLLREQERGLKEVQDFVKARNSLLKSYDNFSMNYIEGSSTNNKFKPKGGTKYESVAILNREEGVTAETTSFNSDINTKEKNNGDYLWDFDIRFNNLFNYKYQEELQNYNYLAQIPNWNLATNRVTQISAIGDVLYTVYHSYIYIISVLLLLGMIGAIILTADNPQEIKIVKKLIKKSHISKSNSKLTNSYKISGFFSPLFLKKLFLNLKENNFNFINYSILYFNSLRIKINYSKSLTLKKMGTILPFFDLSTVNNLYSESILGNLFYFIFATLIIAVLLLFINSYLSLSVKYLDKGGGFECGFTSFVQTRERFNVIFYRVSLLFLVFDLEIILIFPYTAVYQKYQNISKNNVLAFLYILIVGFIYELKEGALNIVKKAHTT